MIFQIDRREFYLAHEVVVEYPIWDLDWTPKSGERIRILDIGANCGAFAVHCLARWPDADITCYEPHPELWEMCAHNVPEARVFQAAVVGVNRPIDRLQLYEGKKSRGTCSLFDNLGEQDPTRSVHVPGFRALHLPAADIVKVDTEGCEVEILSEYPILFSPECPTQCLFVEIHRPNDEVEIERLVKKAGLGAVSHVSRTNGCKTVRYLRTGSG